MEEHSEAAIIEQSHAMIAHLGREIEIVFNDN